MSRCSNVNWGEFCSVLTKTCVAGSPGQGCETVAGVCGTCYRARAKEDGGSSPILSWFTGFYGFLIEEVGSLASYGLIEGNCIRQIDGEDVTKALIASSTTSPTPIKLQYYRPGITAPSIVEVPNLQGVSGFMGLLLCDPGPLASYGLVADDAITHINEESVSPDLFIDMGDDPEGHATSLTYRDQAMAVREVVMEG
jgi:hypothetical protein